MPENKSFTKSYAILICAIVFCMLGLFIFGYVQRYNNYQNLENEKDQDFAIPVIYTIAKPYTQPTTLKLPTYTQAFHVTPIWARTNGYLSRRFVDIGDIVKENQILADIDTPEIDQELARARSDLEGFIAQEEIAEITAARWQELYKRNSEAVAVQDVQEKIAQYQLAVANLEAGRANVKRLESLQSFNKILAPFDGIITQRNVDIGALITQGSNGSNPQQLFEIAKIDVLRVFVNVPQTYYRMIQDGLEVNIYSNEFPNRPFKGTVTRNSNALNMQAQTLLTEVDIKNPNLELLPGMYANVIFEVPAKANSFIVPIAGIIIRSGPPYVALIKEDNTVQLQQVRIERDLGKAMLIDDGIKEGDKLITNPSVRIINGTKVDPTFKEWRM